MNKSLTPRAQGAPASAQALRTRWRALAPRERRLVSLTALVVLTAVVWWVLLAPALRTLREAPARHAQLDAQIERMQALAAQARQWQTDASERPTQAQAQQAIQAAAQSLGSAARISFVGDRATLALQGLPATALGPWLAQVRSNSRGRAVEAHLTRSSAAGAASSGNTSATPTSMPPPTAAGDKARWDGQVVIALPAP